ncbi:MAG: pentapeptide repeat-containing protein [Chloroflexaceae bacterium]|nr:pentapeptide repeat-containing protein [Chloroflexaceae bacterium]
MVVLGLVGCEREEPTAIADPLEQLQQTKECVECDLQGADLNGVDLQGANLNRANLSGANLSGANLAGALLDSTISAGRI